MATGKKAVGMRVIILAIMAVVALRFALVILPSMAKNAGGQANLAIGGAKLDTPNVYDTLFNMGVTFGACEQPKDINKIVELEAETTNEVCWSPKVPTYSSMESPFYECPVASHITNIMFDVDLAKDDKFAIYNLQTKDDGTITIVGTIEPIVGAASSKNNIRDISDKNVRSIWFSVLTNGQTRKFKDYAGAKVTKVACSEVKPVDLAATLLYDTTIMDIANPQAVPITFGYENLGDLKADCTGVTLTLTYANLITGEWGQLKKIDFPKGSCGGEYNNVQAPVAFTPSVPGVYALSAEITPAHDETQTSLSNNNINGASNLMYIVAYKNKYSKRVPAPFNVAKEEGNFWRNRYWYAFDSCHHIPVSHDVLGGESYIDNYLISTDAGDAKINNKATDKMHLFVSGRPADALGIMYNNVQFLQPELDMDLSPPDKWQYYSVGKNFTYAPFAGLSANDNRYAQVAFCGWYKDSDDNNPGGNNQGSGTFDVYAFTDQPNYACLRKGESNPDNQGNPTGIINLKSGDNTVCWLPVSNNAVGEEKYKSGQSMEYFCPLGTTANSILVDLNFASDKDYLEVYQTFLDGHTTCLARYGGPQTASCDEYHANDGTNKRVDLNLQNKPDHMRFYFKTDGDQVRSRENGAAIGAYVKKITCA